MKWGVNITLVLAIVAILFSVGRAPNAVAQQVTVTPGSPSATTSIDGKQIPPPPPKFGGVAAGVRAPEEVNGIKQKPIEGVSMAYTFEQANASPRWANS
ncbi:MAG TPA: hypothetical protein VIX91_16685 [Candidatus Acidoferrum sp.]